MKPQEKGETMASEIVDRTTISTDRGDLNCCIWKRHDAEGREQFAIMQNSPDGAPVEPINGWTETADIAIENMISDCEEAYDDA